VTDIIASDVAMNRTYRCPVHKLSFLMSRGVVIPPGKRCSAESQRYLTFSAGFGAEMSQRCEENEKEAKEM
jgi:hypothetical protein